MNRNKLDNALLRKVEQTPVAPPSDMWNRIASTLNDLRLTAPGDTAGVAPGTAEPAQPQEVKIRRTKRLYWRYAAAAVAVIVGVGIISYRMSRIEELIIADRTPAGIEIVPVEADVPTPAGQTLLANHIEPTARRQTTKTGIIAQVTDDIAADPDLIPYIDASEIDDATENTDPDTDAAASESAADDYRERTQTKSSDMRSEGGVPVYTTFGAEAAGRRKRATPLAVSLYAGNFGGGKTVQNMPGSALRAESSEPVVSQIASENMEASRQSAVYPSVSLKHRFPVSFGLSVSKGITNRLSVETGLVYSYLYSESGTPTGNNQYKHEQKLHYLGIPVGVKYDLFKRPLYNIYTSGGALLEMCVSGQYVQTPYSNGVAGIPFTRRMNIYGIQSSVNMQVGAEFNMSKNFSLYLEPGVSYYFESARQPGNYRTESPINISFKAGIRVRMN